MNPLSEFDHLTVSEQEREFTLTDILVVLGQEKKTVLAIAALGVALSIAIALSSVRIYTASTVIMPPQQQQQNAAANALSQLGNLGGMASTGIKSSEEVYVALLESRSVKDAVVKRLKLADRYGTDLPQDARAILAKKISVSASKKSGLITLMADDNDPVFAAQLANAHVDELRHLMDKIAVTDAQQRRLFFQQQLEKAQTRLNASELQFRQAQSESGMVVSQALAESGVRESAQLRGQIAAREVQMQTLAQFATPQHPDVQRIRAELTAMREQLAQLERGRGRGADLTPHGIKAVQAFRDMKVQEVLLETLIKQLEMARADEAKEGPLVQQIDIAVPPDRPSKPSRAFIVMLGSLIAVTLAITWALLKGNKGRFDNSWQRVKTAWY